MGDPHALQLLCVKPQQSAACDGMVREGLDIGEIVVGTVFLQPLAHVLLSPQDDGFSEAAEGRTGVIDAVLIAGSDLGHLSAGLFQQFDGPASS